uniref:alkaline phosphatase D family protein n=1 Tax=Nocardia abscessus TaxID=120957 RepID=UPI0024570D4B
LRIYRRLRFGTLAELAMLDLRSYRDQEAKPGAHWREADDPARRTTSAPPPTSPCYAATCR